MIVKYCLIDILWWISSKWRERNAPNHFCLTLKEMMGLFGSQTYAHMHAKAITSAAEKCAGFQEWSILTSVERLANLPAGITWIWNDWKRSDEKKSVLCHNVQIRSLLQNLQCKRSENVHTANDMVLLLVVGHTNTNIHAAAAAAAAAATQPWHWFSFPSVRFFQLRVSFCF